MKGNGDRNPRQEPGAGAETEITDDLLAGSLSKIHQDHLLEDGTTYSGLGPPTPIINKENTPMNTPTEQSDGGNSSVQVPSSQVTPVCDMLTKWTGTFAKAPV